MCRATGAGADPAKKKEPTPMRGQYLGPNDGKKYERITFNNSGRRIKG